MPTNHPIHWRLVIGLAMFHLLLLPAVFFIPVWIGGQDALYYRWSRYVHGSLGGAQYELLAGFWAISQWNWAKRTLFFMICLVVLSLLHVAIMFALTGERDSLVEELWNFLLNTIEVFVIEALVLAIFLELFRPLWGCLTRDAPEKREITTIFDLLRLTVMAAVAALAMRSTESSMDLVWFSTDLLLEAAFMVSCLWMLFAPRYGWVGLVGSLASIVSALLNTPAEIVATYGPWHLLPSECLKTFWICSTLVVVRCFGYRLRK